MVITFYTSTANPKQANKANFLTQIGTAKTLNPTRAISTLNPVVYVEYNADFVNSNYCYIGAPFNKYYFCKCAVDVAGKLIVDCVEDSLYTWYNYLIDCPATIIRAESVGVNYVVDEQLPVDTNRYYTEGIEFPNKMKQNPVADVYGKSYLLITNGGSTNAS